MTHHGELAPRHYDAQRTTGASDWQRTAGTDETQLATHVGQHVAASGVRPAADAYAAQRAAGAYDDSDNEVGDDLGLSADPAAGQTLAYYRLRTSFRGIMRATLLLLVVILLIVYLKSVLGY